MWVPSQGKLINVALHHIDEGMKQARVCKFFNSLGSWDMDKLKLCVPTEVYDKIKAIIPAPDGPFEDTLAWKESPDGSFSVASAYKVVPTPSSSLDPIFEDVWKWKGPERIRVHMWKVVKNALVTNELRYKHGFSLDSLCPLCNSTSEDMLHVMRDCYYARTVWNCMANGNVPRNFFDLDLKSWMMTNLKTGKMVNNSPWETIFGATLVLLWHQRSLLRLVPTHLALLRKLKG